jgi:protein-S-isoprenylcysteine O-methyltransferase Ste14
MPQQSHNAPGMIAPPPLIALAALVLGVALDWLLPMFVLNTLLSFWHRLVLGFLLALLAGALVLPAYQKFTRIGTNIELWKPTLHLATDGIYRHVRNPMYQALILLTAGIAIAIGSNWTLVLLVPAAMLLHYGVVL